MGPSRWGGLAALLAGFFVLLLDTTIVAVASPSIQADLGGDVAALFWVTAGYLLAFSVPLLVAGRLGDLFDPKRVYLFGMGGFGVASALCGLAPSMGWLIAFRILQGLAAAAMAPQPLTLIRRLFAEDERGRAFGIWGSVAAAATLLGPILGGLLTASLDWRWIFWVNVPLCAVAVVLGIRLIPGSQGSSTRFDLLGAALSTAGLSLLVWALLSWSPLSVPATALAGVLLVFFWFRERGQGEDALAPVGLYRSSGYLSASLAMASLGATVLAMALPTMLYVQEIRGFGPMEAAMVLAPDAVVAILLSPPAGRWVDRVGGRRPAILGMSLLATSILLIGLVVVLSLNPWWISVGAAFLGAANAMAWSPLSAIAMASVEPDAAGGASGLFNTVRQVGAVTGVAVTGAILAWLESRPALAFAVVFGFVGLVAVGGVAAALRLPGRSRVVEGV
ncbi:drug resistance transporter, EmrB/QacA subfamily [Amycolatopsis lurida]|uniref:Sugar transporter n=1 Tax=Amycolatopsis lurida NRRL 2430 TaxID=1460371 RepID=A0A2P2FFZ5_AMYLU|nr:MFS transporter [Amycolatopsis lurida]KFU75646.1 sugar transporter [Amycolatopsis lurida NRRL 2430]SEB33664.1 drug resistance transporter, EmrB/QacA subfamily [Amycolatopsis lurida]